MPPRLGVRLPTYILIGVAPAFGIAALPLFILGAPHRGGFISPIHIIANTAAVTGAVAWIFGFAVFAFRRMDEYFQARSKFAWYWGGTIGLAASAPVYAFIGMGGLHWLFPGTFHLGADLFRAFVIGYCLPLLGLALGSLIAGVFWRLTRR